MADLPQSALGRVLLALYGAHAGNTPPERTHLQKEMYFLTKRHPRLAVDCAFENHLEGPWSEAVRETARTLRHDGLLVRADYHADQISGEGQAVLQQFRQPETDENASREALLDDIDDVVSFCHQVTPDELLLITYVDAPETREQSVVQQGVLDHRVWFAQAMYDRGVITKTRAAELAGLTVREVQGW